MFDVHAILPADFDQDKFLGFYEKIEKEFPVKQVSIQYETSIRVDQGKDPMVGTSGGKNGFRFRSADGRRIVQFRTNGFSFNKLRPYDKWESFSGEAISYLKEYLAISNPAKITRLALRYINKLDIPLPVSSLKEYLATVPAVAPKLPQEMAEFFMRLVIPDPHDIATVAILTETIDKTPQASPEGILPIILDIDVFKNVSFTNTDLAEICAIFEALRKFKNTVFQESITATMKKLIS